MANRDYHLNQLIASRWNGQVKVVTGLRRCGKSYLLFNLFKTYLLEDGVPPQQIIELALDSDKNAMYRNPLNLGEYLREKTESDMPYYVLLDEIQFVQKVENPSLKGDYITFYEVLNGLLEKGNVDIYVTGSNSHMLSEDVLTQFRGRGYQIHLYPFSFSEFHAFYQNGTEDDLRNYMIYGGMPGLLHIQNDEGKTAYLENLINEIYIRDIRERHHIKNEAGLSEILSFLASSIGSLSNPTKITHAVNSSLHLHMSVNTITDYIKYLEQAFLISTAKRYDIRGKRYFDYPNKYYFTDVGLRNAKLGFRQMDRSFLMENTIYNELKIRGLLVDVGVVYDSKNIQKEIDFVVNKQDRRIYIQSAFQMGNEKKEQQELTPLMLTRDFFKKICIRTDILRSYQDDHGIYQVTLSDFLLNPQYTA